MLKAVSADTSGPALEIGCGSGIFSKALVQGGAFAECLITDASLQFVRMTRRAVEQAAGAEVPSKPVRVWYGLLPGEGLERFPDRSFSLVAARYVLHHILDWESFIGRTARLLRPGGVLTFEEPCREGFLLQAVLLHFLPTLMDAWANRSIPSRLKRYLPGRAAAAAERRAVAEKVQRFVDTIGWSARRDVDKSGSEDKHLFRIPEVIRAGRRHGLEVEFFPNAGYDSLGTASPEVRLDDMLFHNLRTNFGFDERFVELVKQHLGPHLHLVRQLSAAGGTPYTKGVFACKRIA
jgi:SAM-dependent methyltransferase